MLVVICCLAGIAVAEEKNILISSGTDRATPIAVVPFGWQGGNVLPDDMAEIIGNDLRNSGYYAPIPKQNMISLPTQASEVIYRDWKALGAQYIMVGSIVPAGGRLQVQYALFNVATEQQVLTGSVSGSVDQLRDMSHYIADQSFEKLTGIKGAFSTRMLYVTAERFSENNTRYTLQRSDYDGARAVTLLQSREPILSPRFAPDGKRIAYVSFEQKRPRIFVQPIDTGRREQITNFEGLNGAPAWSPDGSRGAVTRIESHSRSPSSTSIAACAAAISSKRSRTGWWAATSSKSRYSTPPSRLIVGGGQDSSSSGEPRDSAGRSERWEGSSHA